MPHKGTVDFLRNIVVEFLAESLHTYAKICAKWIRQKKKAVSGRNQSKRVKDIQDKLEDCLKLFSEIGVCICHSSSLLEDRFQSRIRQLILSETGLLDETYYLVLGRTLLNGSLRKLSLDQPRLFQDSSFALETFLFGDENDSGLSCANRLREFQITKTVCELIDFDFEPTLINLGGPCYPNLSKIVIQGLNEISISRKKLLHFSQRLLHGYEANIQATKDCRKSNDSDVETNDIVYVVDDIQSSLRSSSVPANLLYIDLSNSSLDDECCQALSSIKTLTTILINNCADATTKGILACLENLNVLERIEANKGHNSTVQQAIKMLDGEQCHQEDATIANTLVEKTNITSFPNIKHFLFRNPRAGLEVVSKYCPSVNKVRIIYNVYEYSYDARLDDCLIELITFQQFQENLKSFSVQLDLNCMNMLFIIQLRELSKYGKAITDVTLTEAEFVHPQTLNPIALNCPRLNSLALINPSTISDNLFVGEVPELAPDPFSSLQHVVFEGEVLSAQLAGFLFKSAIKRLETIKLAVETYTPEFKGALSNQTNIHMIYTISDAAEILQFLIKNPRPRMKSISLCLGTFPRSVNSHTNAEEFLSEAEDFAACLSELVEVSPTLNGLDIFVRKSYEKDLEKLLHKSLKDSQMNFNWDISYRFVIK